MKTDQTEDGEVPLRLEGTRKHETNDSNHQAERRPEIDKELLSKEIYSRYLETIEPQLIERETRLVPLALNLINYARPWCKTQDPRSTAAIKAVLWRIFSPATLLVTGGVFTLLVSMATLMLLAQQNSRMDQQTYIADASRSASLVSELGSLMADITEFANSVCTDLGPSDNRKSCWNEYARPFRDSFVQLYIRNTRRRNTASGNIDFYSSQIAPMVNAIDGRPPVLPLPPRLQGRLSVLVNALKPYKYIDYSGIESISAPHREHNLINSLSTFFGVTISEAPVLAQRAASPERGLLLASLVELGINLEVGLAYSLNWEYSHIEKPQFRDTWLRWRNFANSSFRCGDFSGANLVRSSFRNADLRSSNFSGEKTNLHATAFIGANLSRTKFLDAKLPKAAQFKDANLDNVDLHGSTTVEQDFLIKLAKSTKNFDSRNWRIVEFHDNPEAKSENNESRTPVFQVEHISGQQLGLGQENCR